MTNRTRFTHRARCLILLVFVFATISMLGISPALSQWTIVKNFAVEVHSVYFLDQQGASTTGFAGLANSAIWRTIDNGVTWTQMLTPFTPTPGQITDFAFSNTLIGWCSVRFSDYSTGEIWKTTDGGLTWNSIYTGGAFVSIAYSPVSGVLIAPCWGGGTDSCIKSTDGGASWTGFAPVKHNGATFSGSNAVVGFFNTDGALYSSNGGATWSVATGLSVEVWAPHGIPGSSIFVAVSEKDSTVYKSTDGGATWASIYTFIPSVHPIGCIMGSVAKMLFMQTEDNGFYFSSDTGASWSNVCGPNNSVDTRFYAIGKSVFAGDYNGNLWHTSDGTISGNSVLGLDRMSLNFFGLRCSTYDSILHFYYGAGCNTATLTKAQILTGAAEFSLGTFSLPQSFSGVDSIGVFYTPSEALHDTGTLLLEFNIGPRIVDTIVHLYGTGQSASAFSHVDSLAIDNPYACMTTDTSIVLHNLSCDTLTLFRATIGNQAIFQLLPLNLPIKIRPHDSTIISITASSGQDGSFPTFLKITTLTSGGVLLGDSIPITLTVQQGGEALFSPLDLSEPYACSGIDTTFTISATPCDSIILLSATLSDTSIFHLGANTFPTSIKASGAAVLPIHVQPGSKGLHSTILHLHYKSGQIIIDTSITLTMQILYDLPLHLDLTSNSYNLGNADVPCETASRWITFQNGLCRDLTIKRISWVNSNNEFWFDPASLPDTLAHDTGEDSILVHFSPTSAVTESNQLRITLDLDGREHDTVLTISGTGVQAYHDSLLTPILQFDSVAECLSSEQEGEIVNLSCDSVRVVSATFAGSQGYSLSSPALPVGLSHGDTLHVRFLLKPNQTGLASDKAIITLHDIRNDSDYTDTITLSGYVVAGRHALSLSSSTFSLPTIAACSVIDSFLIVTNLGCDDVIINDTSLVGYPGIKFLPPLTLPDTIASDSSLRIPFRILPNRDSPESTQLRFQGQNIDITISFTYAALPGAPALTLSIPDSMFVTRPCVPVVKTFWIANTGCGLDTLDTLALNGLPGSSQFTLQNPPTLPYTLAIGDTLHFTIQFDPNGNGNGLTTLDINSKGANLTRSVALAGSVRGTVPTARIALQASDGSSQCSGMANQLTSVVAKLLDGIGDSTALSTVTITLRANWNLLTPVSLSSAPGWSVLDTNTLANGDFQIRIHHDVGGAVAAGTILVTCPFLITVSDSTGCDIGMSDLRFEDGSTSYQDCVLSSIAMPDAVHFTETDTCGTPELRGLMEGRLALSIISVIPNPATITGGAAPMNVTFNLARAEDIRIIVRDVIGRECFSATKHFTAGTHTLNVDVPGAAEGMYFIQLEAEGQVAQAKVIVQSTSANLPK